MAVDATGTPTTLGIPRYDVTNDAPSGLGFNAAMQAIDDLLSGAPLSDQISGIAVGSVPVWNGSAWVKPSGTPTGSKFLRDDGAWATPGGNLSYGTSLPGSPSDGDEAILVDSTTAPTYQWRFRYNAGSASANKWEYVGGAPAVSRVAGVNQTTTASFADLSGGPSFTAPRAGDYLVRYGSVITAAPTAFVAVMDDNTVASASTWAFGTTGSSTSWYVGDEGIRALAASAVVKLRIKRTIGADNNYGFTQLRVVVTPMRVA